MGTIKNFEVHGDKASKILQFQKAIAMSLALIQSYSSAEEEEEQPQPRDVHLRYNTDDDDDSDDDDDRRPHEASTSLNLPIIDRSLFDQPLPSSNATGLPSAFDAFSEVFLSLSLSLSLSLIIIILMLCCVENCRKCGIAYWESQSNFVWLCFFVVVSWLWRFQGHRSF